MDANQTSVCSPYPPFHPDGTTLHFPAEWLSDTVCALAHGTFADLAFDRLPILADALEEAGCDEPLILNHCRYCPHHVPECWVVEQLVRSDVLWTGERHSSAVGEAARQGHPDDPAVVPGRPWDDPASETPEQSAEAERRQERRDRWAMRVVWVAAAIVVVILVMMFLRL